MVCFMIVFGMLKSSFPKSHTARKVLLGHPFFILSVEDVNFLTAVSQAFYGVVLLSFFNIKNASIAVLP